MRTHDLALGAFLLIFNGATAAAQTLTYEEQTRVISGFGGSAGQAASAPDFGPATLEVSDSTAHPDGAEAAMLGIHISELRSYGIFLTATSAAEAHMLYAFSEGVTSVVFRIDAATGVLLDGRLSAETIGIASQAITSVELWSLDPETDVRLARWELNLSTPDSQALDVDQVFHLPAGLYRFNANHLAGNWIEIGRAISSVAMSVMPIDEVCRADWNSDGLVNTNDFIAYLIDYSYTNVGAPFIHQDPDIAAPIGTLNTADFLEFLNAFTTGCR